MAVTGGTTQAYGAKSKSLLLAVLLTFFLGPFGMFYTTVFGALVMLVFTLPAVLLTAGAAWGSRCR